MSDRPAPERRTTVAKRAWRLSVCLMATWLCADAALAAAVAADAHSAPASKPAPQGKLPAASAAPTTQQDPLDMLRDKLAARLGATKTNSPAGASSAPVVQVSSRATGEFTITPGKASVRPASRSKPDGAAGKQGVVAPAPAQASADAGHGAHWSYHGDTGPQAWGGMKPEFTQCSKGARQSPIDIRDGFGVELEPVVFAYRTSNFSVVDNGHTVQVNVAAGNFIEVLGRQYELQQFHFHRPSEEQVNGRVFDMSAHLVHKDLEGRLAVVAVLLQRGGAHPLIQKVWNNLPLEKGEALPARVTIDLHELLPTDRRYYTYMGSLTTPPCNEGVLWMVMRQPVSLAAEQIDLFSRLYPMNARPIQSTAGRMIKQSN